MTDEIRPADRFSCPNTPEFDAGKDRDVWVPGCGGHESPFTIKGRRLLYCYNHLQDRHAYIDLDRDMELSEEEVRALLP